MAAGSPSSAETAGRPALIQPRIRIGDRIIHDLIFDYTLRTVALGSAILGLVSGALGSFAVLRRQALLGDAVSHAALPGIVLAFLFTGSKAPLVLMLGAAATGWLGTLLVLTVVRRTRLKEDAALGIVLSVFFGAGLVMITRLQKSEDAAQAGLEDFLFGQAAALVQRDLLTMGLLGSLALLLLLLFWKEFKLLSFDPEFAVSVGLPTARLNILLTSLIVIAVVIGLQTVGVVLMSALLVAPAAAARQWTERLGVMVLLAGAIGAAAGISGSIISSSARHLPTGPVVVLVVSLLTLVSLLFAPGRGVFARFMESAEQRRRFAVEALTVHLLHHENRPEEAVENTIPHLRQELLWDTRTASRVVRRASGAGLLVAHMDKLELTTAGREAARSVMERS